MFSRVLMVCTGNVCRSPMAAAVFAERLRQRGIAATVDSAGIAALVGRPAHPMAQLLMAERHLDLSHHRARQLTSDLVHGFELVLVMEAEQQAIIEARHPTARGRVHRIGRVAGFDVPDPYRDDRAAFEYSLELIERGLHDLEKLFWSRSQ